jgi:hypothetical protein
MALLYSPSLSFPFVNIANILPVTRKPPTTFTIARTMATRARDLLEVVMAAAAAVRAPKTVTPEIALVPDINGVCSKEGTLVIAQYPIRPESTKTRTSIGFTSYRSYTIDHSPLFIMLT